MKRFICIHGHFYQPPRENPWLEAVELQDSAYPYHDWNEKVTAESYAPNATSRILDGEGRIVQLVNNYSRISFNFGPTLLAWMERNAPEIYEAIIEADRQSAGLFQGHGSAMAQAYNHMIMPLATLRDKETQIVWGVKDFQKRFGRDPEGMWLPETAVDLETLDLMARHGLKFTVLAPRQAHRVKLSGSPRWEDISGGRIDPTRSYRVWTPSGREMALFFYDGPISQALAFEGLLSSGEALAHRLLGAFSNERSHDQLVHIATDGESYGHHHPRGDMALAYAIHYIESNKLAEICNYGLFLSKNPPDCEVEIFENSSWSCVHGVERWRENCGCNSGGYPQWNQGWRKPLREALDWLRDTLEPAYESAAEPFFVDPWNARDDFLDVILDRSPESSERFLEAHARRELTAEERVAAFELLELQRHCMLMYTSCGWFFDELSGIETVQIVTYAARALQLAKKLFGAVVEPRFLQLLSRARSNIPEHRDGRVIFEKWVRPSMVDSIRVGAHYAVSSLFEQYEARSDIGPYQVFLEDYNVFPTGRAKLVVGRARFVSSVTGASEELSFGVLHLGDHNLNCGVREYQGEERYEELVREVSEAFGRANFAETIRLMDKHFGVSTYSLKSLFLDEQRKVVNEILRPPLEEVESATSSVYDHHAPLMVFLASSDIPTPKPLGKVAEFVLNARLRNALQEGFLEVQVIGPLLAEAQQVGARLDVTTLEYVARAGIEGIARQWAETPEDLDSLKRLNAAAALIRSLPFETNLRTAQNLSYKVMESYCPEISRKARKGHAPSAEWMEVVAELADRLWIIVPQESSGG